SDKDKSNLFSYCCHECYREGKGMLSISEKIIENAFLNYLDRINIEYDEEDLLKDDSQKEINNLKSELRSLGEEKKRIQKAWIKGFIEEEDLIEHQKEVDSRVLEVEDKLKSKTNAPTISNEQILAIQSTLKENYDVMTK